MSYSLNKTKFLNEAEVLTLTTQLNEFLKDKETSHYRDAMVIMLALSTGGRAQEVLNIRKCDLDSHNKTVFLRGLKGSNDREIPLQPAFFQKLWTFVLDKTDEETLFNISYIRLWQIWQMWKPSKKSIHSLRHTFALKLYRRSKDIRLVQQALGHKSINSTLIYQSYSYNTAEMKRAIL